MDYRIEHDSMGEMRVPCDRYYGAQTARSLENFTIGEYRMPAAVIRAFGALKLAAARVNARLVPSRMTSKKCAAIEAAAREVMDGTLLDHFPLVVFQTGSGTQSNMNANEVIAARANELLGERLLHPNDDVNMSQSSNDTFPTAMHLSAVLEVEGRLLPPLRALIGTLLRLEDENRGVVKSGRTHLEDATPIAFSQEISGWRASLERDLAEILTATGGCRALAIGGTAVGTGLNAPSGFGDAVAAELTSLLGTPFTSAENKFSALTSLSPLVRAHAALKALAADLFKIANDVRWLASGPRCGLGEITIPENEPGSSIMPGKVNPTQCEALTMVAVQVMANDTAVTLAASQGNLQLNVFLPVTIHNFLASVRLLSDAIASFDKHCASGIKANRERMKKNLHSSLMTATALSPLLGYERTAALVKLANDRGLTLREAVLSEGAMTAEEFDAAYHPEDMV